MRGARMSQPTHTPGPWRAYRDCIVADIPRGEFKTTAVAYYGDEMRHAHGLPFGEERDANGLVLAASTEMLALLQELIDIEGPQPGTSAWAEKTRATIAKAMGAA